MSSVRGVASPLIKLTIFLVVTAFATYVLGATIANTSYGSTTSYRADFTDASGLQVGDDIRIAGVRVGSVTGVKVVEHNLAQVSFTVLKSRPLPTSVIARLRYRNLIGQRYVDIEQGVGNPNQYLKHNAVIPVSQTQNALDLTALFDGFQPLFQGLDATQINSLSNEIIQALQGEGGSLDLLLSNLGDLTNSLADKDSVIGDLIDNLNSVLTAVGSRDTELSNLILQLQGFVSGLAQDRQTIGASIDGINALATSTAGLLTQVRAPLAKDVTDLTGLTDNLNANKSTLQYVITNLAPTVAGLIRTASYGSWFNFYLCSVSGTITLPGAIAGKPVTLNLDSLSSSQARCQ
jgi:phospholipid/cholesterol/gamma-HCH transport system substrate-binding protein